MFTVVVGKTCSGKTTVVDKLVSLYRLKKIVTYTNRVRRKGEKDGIDYHFISTEEFKQKINDGFFAEWKCYETVEGDWYYGSALEDLENADDDSIIILTPQGYRDACQKLSKKPVCIYMYANNSTIKKRLISRGDDEKEAERRLKQDNKDFKDFEYEADKIFYNNSDTGINSVVERIINFVR